MIWAIAEPVIGGQHVPACDVIVWEQVSSAPSRCHEGLLQLFIKSPMWPTGQWVSFGRLLARAESWEQMMNHLKSQGLTGKRVTIVPAGERP